MKKILFVITLLSLVGCGSSKEPNVELVQNMMDQPSVKAQDYNLEASDRRANKMPPDHVVAIGAHPYKFKGKPKEAGEQLKNPVPASENIALGRERFETYCMVCHGPKAKGDGTVAPKMMVTPPSLLTSKIRGWSDGSIFHVITDGQGMMGSYAGQIIEKDRWLIVNYRRQLQKENKE
ncbi:MAG: cytochrome c [Bdellovibrionales bacterium]|nr:cytochrome c [Bdellovibrionales bacterium]